MKKNSVTFGVVLILTALLIIVSVVGKNVGFIPESVNLLKIVGTVACAGWIVGSLCKGKFEMIFIPAGLIFFIFRPEIAAAAGIENPDELVPTWVVIVCMILFTIGVGALRSGKHKSVVINRTGDSTVVDVSDENSESCSMGNHVKYIDCSDFGTRKIENNMGRCEIHFENPELYNGEGVLCVDNNFGKMEIHVPCDWRIETNMDNNFGGVSAPSDSENGEKLLKIIGDNNFGAMEIVRD